MIKSLNTSFAAALVALCAMPLTANAQDEEGRTRIGLGPQFVPSYPGADGVVLRPLGDFSRADEGEEFAFEAPDENFGFVLVDTGRLSFGPVAGLEGSRSSSDTSGLLPDVDLSIELGGFVQAYVSDALRLRTEVRQGVTGHEGLIADLSADYVMRDGDRQVISIGPRLSFADARYQGAYFGVDPVNAFPPLLPAYDPDGGLQSVGAALGVTQQFNERWGIVGYAKYDRLVGDAGDSPVVARFGSKDQYAGGVALTYTFDGKLF